MYDVLASNVWTFALILTLLTQVQNYTHFFYYASIRCSYIYLCL